MEKKKRIAFLVIYVFTLSCVANLTVSRITFADESELKNYPIKIAAKCHTLGQRYYEEFENTKEQLKKRLLKNLTISKQEAIEIVLEWCAHEDNIRHYSSLIISIDERDVEAVNSHIFCEHVKFINNQECEYTYRLVWEVLCCKKNIFIRVDAITGEVLGIWQCAYSSPRSD